MNGTTNNESVNQTISRRMLLQHMDNAVSRNGQDNETIHATIERNGEAVNNLNQRQTLL